MRITKQRPHLKISEITIKMDLMRLIIKILSCSINKKQKFINKISNNNNKIIQLRKIIRFSTLKKSQHQKKYPSFKMLKPMSKMTYLAINNN